MIREFEGRLAVITGAGHGIGLAIKQAFEQEGARTFTIDVNPGCDYQGDIGDRATLEQFADEIKTRFGGVDFIINNAPPLMKGISECTYEEFTKALSVGVTAPFYLVKLLSGSLNPGAAVVNISSSRDLMSQAETESYTAAKGGISALTHALAVSLAGKARVNAISPGWIDTEYRIYSGPDAYQQPAGRVGTPRDIAEAALFLCSERAGFITGQNLRVDGGMTKLMIYHGDNGWSLE